MRLADPDLWGYLAYGRLFVEQRQLTSQDLFAYTSAGSRWVTFEYLAHIALWLAYAAGGTTGLVALKCAVGAAALAFVYRAIRDTTDDVRVWVPVFAFSASTVARFFLFRPQIFTFAFFAYFVFVLGRFLRRGAGPLWTLPLVMLLWANTHGGFLAGLGALGLAILLRAGSNLQGGGGGVAVLAAGTRPLWLALAGSVVATFVTPQGVHLWRYVATEMTHGTNRQYIAEWAPISFSHGDVWSSLALAVAAALVAGGVWIASPVARAMRPAPWVWAISCVPIVAMSCLSVRHVPIAVIWCAPIVASLWAAGRPQLSWPWRATWTAFSAIALTTVYLALVVVWMEPRPTVIEEGRVLGPTHPCRVVQFARDRRLAGNVYAPLWWGSYITWVLYPDVRVAMDGRNISLYPEAMVVENLKFYAAAPDAVDAEVPLRYPTDFLLAPADMAALSRLLSDPRWNVIYKDADAVLFVRAGSGAPPHAAARRVPETAPAFERCGPTL